MRPIEFDFTATSHSRSIAQYADAIIGRVQRIDPRHRGVAPMASGRCRGVALERWFAAGGIPPRLDLARSHAPELRLDRLLRLAGPGERGALDGMSLGYGDARGDVRLRAAVANAGMAGSPEEVLVACGASQALLLAAAAAGPPARDAAMVAGPGYSGPLRACEAAGLRVSAGRVWKPGSPALQIDTLIDGGATPAGEALAPERLRCVVVNSPHNPSGQVIPPHELERLARWCGDRGAVLIVDEVALGSLDGRAVSAAQLPAYRDGLVAVCGDVSKALGLGGLRTGWLACADPGLLDRAASLLDVVGLGTAGVAQRLAAIALERRDALLPAVRRLARRNRAALGRWVENQGCDWVPPRDGLVSYVCLAAGASATATAAAALEAGVAVVPGDLLGAPGGLRIGLGLPGRDFDRALDALAASMARPVAA